MHLSLQMKQLGEKGLEMIRASNKHPELKGCWVEIGKPRTSGATSFTVPLLYWLATFCYYRLVKE
jgi:hypothetical protein